MNLAFKIGVINEYPLGGILIRGSSVRLWLEEIQRMKFSIENIRVFPIPGHNNEPWGCLVVKDLEGLKVEINNNEYCQRVFKSLFIPERTRVLPKISLKEHDELFENRIHLFHPEIGLMELENPLNLDEIIELPKLGSEKIYQPQESVFIPHNIKSFQIESPEPEEVLKSLEQMYPEKKEIEDKPLSIFEKGKLGVYRFLFKKDKAGTGNEKSYGQNNDNDSKDVEKSKILKVFETLNPFKKSGSSWTDNMLNDYKDLEVRNQKVMDKLLNMFKNNPEKALDYAIPLSDEIGRGSEPGQLALSKRWGGFGLFNFSDSGSGGGIVGDNYYNTLSQQYRKTALELIEKKDFKKAAFIYMKLLKDYHTAAVTLRKGGMYQEAAMVYIKFVESKLEAAQCYEEGRMYNEAINLYKDLNNYEKVGDLLTQTNQLEEASSYYKRAVGKLLNNNNHLKASEIYKVKLNDHESAQSILLEGWEKNVDSYNCLKRYFFNISDVELLKAEYNSVYGSRINSNNMEKFFDIVVKEMRRVPELEIYLKDLGYELLAKLVVQNPGIVKELKDLNPRDREITKDIYRFGKNYDI